MADQPALGYGNRTEASIDAVNQWMRSTPWYQQKLASWGQSPASVHLSDWQKQDLIRTAQANGVVVDEGHNGQQIDDSGNFEAKGHGLRNTLIVAGIAAAALATMGAAGVFSAGAGVGAGAGGGAATAGAGTLASTITAPTVGSLVTGGTGLAAGAGTLANLIAPPAAGGALKFLSSPGGSTLASTLAGTFANIYGANKQADASRYGVDAQSAAAKYAADLEDAAAKRAEGFSRQQAETGWQSGEQAQKSNYDQWAARQRAITGSLGAQLGIDYQIPDYVPGIDPHYLDGSSPAPGGTAPPSTTNGPAAPTQFIKTLLDQGVDPQAAIQQTNEKFKLGTGSQAVYYDPSQHGGVATIGLPDSYLALTNGKWDVTQRSGASPAPARQSTVAAPTAYAPPVMTPTTPIPQPYQPGTIGAYLQGRTR